MTIENRKIRLLASTVASDFQKAEKSRKSKQICRCDGIGRRDGLKIRWTYHPCGFESHHRHHGPFSRGFFCAQRDPKNANIWAFSAAWAESRHQSLLNKHPLYHPLSILLILLAPYCHFHLFSIFDPRFCTVFRHFPDLRRPFQGANKSVAFGIVEATEKGLIFAYFSGKNGKIALADATFEE